MPRLKVEEFEVRPDHQLTFKGTHKPEIRGSDTGIWRRVLRVPFDTKADQAAVRGKDRPSGAGRSLRDLLRPSSLLRALLRRGT